MEKVARRKAGLLKDKSGVDDLEALLRSPALVASVRKTWMLWLCLGCMFTISACLLLHESCTGTPSWATNVKLKISDVAHVQGVTSTEFDNLLPDPTPTSIYVQDAVVFPDAVLLVVRVSKFLNLEGNIDNLECRFGAVESDSVESFTTPVLSIKRKTRELQMVRCGLPNVKGFPSKFDNNVTLGVLGSDARIRSNAIYHAHPIPNWQAVVYESVADSNSLVLLAKGVATKSSQRVDESSLVCVFGSLLPSKIVYQTPVLASAQEIIRCRKPPYSVEKILRGQRVSVKASWLGVLPSVTYYNPDDHPKVALDSSANHRLNTRATDTQSGVSASGEVLGVAEEEVKASAATKSEEKKVIEDLGKETGQGRGAAENAESKSDAAIVESFRARKKLCACMMVWNKARFLREWMMYHNYLGAEKFFIFDNDSDDDTKETLEYLKSSYEIDAIFWPWQKTQQAAFSYMTVLARPECEWMMFIDVDEYAFPSAYLRKPGSDSPSDAMVLHRLIDRESEKMNKSLGPLGAIQYDCHNFGPSGLEKTPVQGVTVGYTCRMKNPERHKSIIRLDAVNTSLLNVLHHFELLPGYQTLRVGKWHGVVNHYKFQAWDTFRMKFVRRAGTYTTDWKKSTNTGSKDRTPGLGTKAVKPDDWESQFCEVQDTALRDFVVRTFSRQTPEGEMRWQVDENSHALQQAASEK